MTKTAINRGDKTLPGIRQTQPAKTDVRRVQGGAIPLMPTTYDAAGLK